MKVKMAASGPLKTEFGHFQMYVFEEQSTSKEHIALVVGDLVNGEKPLIRMHSSCITGESFAATNCECKHQLHEAMKLIQGYGHGAILYLDQEGRGNGLSAKVLALNEVIKGVSPVVAFEHYGFPHDQRDYTVAALMLKSLGVQSQPIKLLTNNPSKINGLVNNGIVIDEAVDIYIETDYPLAKIDQKSKRDDLGYDYPEEI